MLCFSVLRLTKQKIGIKTEKLMFIQDFMPLQQDFVTETRKKGGKRKWGLPMAKKSLEDMLSENTELPGVKGGARRQAVFLTYWEQIEAAYKEGWSYSDIWLALTREGIIDFGYSTFLHYKDKRKRRMLEVEKQKQQIAAVKAEREGGPAAPAKPSPQSREAGSLPVFGQPGVKRDNKRF